MSVQQSEQIPDPGTRVRVDWSEGQSPVDEFTGTVDKIGRSGEDTIVTVVADDGTYPDGSIYGPGHDCAPEWIEVLEDEEEVRQQALALEEDLGVDDIAAWLKGSTQIVDTSYYVPTAGTEERIVIALEEDTEFTPDLVNNLLWAARSDGWTLYETRETDKVRIKLCKGDSVA